MLHLQQRIAIRHGEVLAQLDVHSAESRRSEKTTGPSYVEVPVVYLQLADFCRGSLATSAEPSTQNVNVPSRPVVNVMAPDAGAAGPLWPEKLLVTSAGPLPSAHVFCQPVRALKSGMVNA